MREAGHRLACASVGPIPELHVCISGEHEGSGLFAGPKGDVLHTLRHRSGAWEAVGDVQQVVGALPGRPGPIACAGLRDGSLHVCVVTHGGGVWHTIRYGGGSWSGWGNMLDTVGTTGVPSDITCATAADGSLHVILQADAKVWHTIRYGDGSWSGWGDLLAVVGNVQLYGGGDTFSCACGPSGELHVVGHTFSGPCHTIRAPNGSWTPWGFIATGGEYTAVRDCATSTDGTLHVLGTRGNYVWTTVRHLDGSWSGWRNVGAL